MEVLAGMLFLMVLLLAVLALYLFLGGSGHGGGLTPLVQRPRGVFVIQKVVDGRYIDFIADRDSVTRIAESGYGRIRLIGTNAAGDQCYRIWPSALVNYWVVLERLEAMRPGGVHLIEGDS
jgi:hypothetical protein